MKLNKKTIVIVAVAVVLAVVLFFIIRKIVKNKSNRDRIRDNAQTIAELERASGRSMELSDAEQSHIAELIHDAIDGVGTKERQLANAIESIPTAADYLAIKNAYAKEYESDMYDDIADDVEPNGSALDSIFGAGGDEDDRIIWGRINAHLNLISVPENLR